jgi:hypothetical protein
MQIARRIGEFAGLVWRAQRTDRPRPLSLVRHEYADRYYTFVPFVPEFTAKKCWFQQQRLVKLSSGQAGSTDDFDDSLRHPGEASHETSRDEAV